VTLTTHPLLMQRSKIE